MAPVRVVKIKPQPKGRTRAKAVSGRPVTGKATSGLPRSSAIGKPKLSRSARRRQAKKLTDVSNLFNGLALG